MPGLPLSLRERDETSVSLIEDRSMSWAAIGRRVERDPTTIAREVALVAVATVTGRRSLTVTHTAAGLARVSVNSRSRACYATG